MKGVELYFTCLVDSIIMRLQARQSGVGSLSEKRDLYCLPNIQTKFGAHPASYSVVTGGCFHRVKAAGM
jgi:hypothetical protein